jgi:hypothetical protein
LETINWTLNAIAMQRLDAENAPLV